MYFGPLYGPERTHGRSPHLLRSEVVVVGKGDYGEEAERSVHVGRAGRGDGDDPLEPVGGEARPRFVFPVHLHGFGNNTMGR